MSLNSLIKNINISNMNMPIKMDNRKRVLLMCFFPVKKSVPLNIKFSRQG